MDRLDGLCMCTTTWLDGASVALRLPFGPVATFSTMVFLALKPAIVSIVLWLLAFVALLVAFLHALPFFDSFGRLCLLLVASLP